MSRKIVGQSIGPIELKGILHEQASMFTKDGHNIGLNGKPMTIEHRGFNEFEFNFFPKKEITYKISEDNERIIINIDGVEIEGYITSVHRNIGL